jgi:thiol-disulfide isomerase/thioredoxin
MMKLDFLPVSAGKGIRDCVVPVALFAVLLGLSAPVLAEKPPIAGDMKDFITAEPVKPVPAFAITDLEGKEVTLDALKGKVVVLNLWATWCVPCIKEMPSLERLSVKMKDKGVAVMSVSQDRGGMKQVGPFLDKHGLKALPIYLDAKGAVLKAIAGRGLPTTLVIDKEGREIGRLEGDAEWDGPHAIALIEHYLK